MTKTLIKISGIALILGFLGGCANTEQINEIRSMAEDAQATANNASGQASRALSTANEALDLARQADSSQRPRMLQCQFQQDRSHV